MDTSGPNDGLELVVESFLARFRAGERPAVEEYAARYPELADQVRELLPALVMVEQDLSLGGQAGAASGDGASVAALTPRHLGDYLILREIGRGGMGVVYEAVQQSLGRHVALKVLPWSRTGSAAHLERFRLEARAAARLHHTNIVPVFGVGEQEGTHYFAMQYIRGQGLDVVVEEVRRLRRERGGGDSAAAKDPEQGIAGRLLTGRLAHATGAAPGGIEATASGSNSTRHGRTPSIGALAETGKISPQERTEPVGSRDEPPSVLANHSDLVASEGHYFREVARIALQVAEALSYAHEQGILHRDIKPSNLMVDAQGTVWVTDFGLAKSEGSDGPTETGDILGTLRYMAPERFAGRSDARGDLYSLGATLYELLALRPAFDEADRASLIRQVTQEDAPRLRTINRKVPPDLETIVHKAMAREPGQRYRTAAELAEDLKRYLEGRPILARRVTPAERFWRWSKRNPGLSGLSAALLLALVSGTIVASALAARARQQAEKAKLEARRANDEAKRASGLTGDLKASLKEKNRLLAAFYFERGQGFCEKDQVGLGLLWMLESWRLAADAGDRGWQHTARTGLAAWQRRHARLKEVFPHRGPVNSVSFSPDGKIVLTGGVDGMARLWDAAAGRPIGDPMIHRAAVLSVAFSPHGKTVLTGSSDRTAQLWDTTTARTIGSLMTHRGAVLSVAFSPDGKRVLTGDDVTARLWDSATGQPIGEPMSHPDPVLAVAFSPDGKTVLTGTGSGDLTGTSTSINPRRGSIPLTEKGRGDLTWKWRGDGEFRSGAAWLWDAATGTLIGKRLRLQAPVLAVTFSPDGRTIVTGCDDRTAQLWDAATGQPVGPSMTHRGAVLSVAFGAAGKTLLTGSGDGMAQLWDAATGTPIGLPMTHRGAVHSVAFSSDGEAALTGCSDAAARLWDAAADQPLGLPLRHLAPVNAVAFSPDGRRLLTGSGKRNSPSCAAQLWDVATGQPVGPLMTHRGPVLSVAFSPDGKTFVTGSWDCTVQFWDTATSRHLGLPLTLHAPVYAVAFSPNGKTILTGSWDRMTLLWDTATRARVGEPMIHQGVVRAVAFSPDGKCVLTGSGTTAQLWDAATEGPLGPAMTHGGTVSSVAFGGDGKTLLTGCEDGTAQLWDTATSRPLGAPLTHQGSVNAVAFSPDGKTVLSGGDRTARLWDAVTGERVGEPMTHPDRVRAVAFSPDGKRVITGGEDNTARLWEVPILPDDPRRVSTWVEIFTGLELDRQRQVRTLDSAAWRDRRERLGREGGPPATGDPRRLDPILFGPIPTARARAWVERQYWDEAEAAFKEALAARPFDTAILLERARFFTDRSQPEKADADLARAYALGARDRELVEKILGSGALSRRIVAQADGVAASFWAQSGEDRARRGHWVEAEADYARAVALKPDDPMYWKGLGTVRAERSQPEKAAEAFAQAMALIPESRSDWLWTNSDPIGIGEALAHHDDIFARVVRIRPKDWTLLIARFHDLGRGGHWSAAAEMAARLVDLDPSDQYAWNNLATLKLYLGDVEGYRRACHEMLSRFGATTDPNVARRTCYTLTLRPVAAADRQKVARLSAVDTNQTYGYSLIAKYIVDFREGLYDKAITGLGQRAATIGPTSPVVAWLHFGLAMAYQKSGHPDDARRELGAGVDWLEQNTPRFERGEKLPYGFWHDYAKAEIYRREAEALILYDPIFPADPFAQ